jgi:threonine dehydrogenase-like Zn-dependent dehydrogenase
MGFAIESQIVELVAARQLAIRRETLDLDSLPADSLAAETLYSAISPGTEIAAYTGKPPLRPGRVFPRLLGYCNVAEVTAIGAAVRRYRVGDRILTFQSHRTAFVAREESVITRVPEGADLAVSATTYLFHLGYNALLRGGLAPGYHVGVIGLGTLGLGGVMLTSLFGGNVLAFSHQEPALALARRFGARLALRKDDPEIAAAVARETAGCGLDLVITTSNQWSDWKLALSLPRKGGVICVLGFPGRSHPIPDFNPLDSQYFYDRQLSLIACGYSPDLLAAPEDVRFTVQRNCVFLLEEITRGRLRAGELVGSIVDWHEIGSIYETMAARRASPLTVVLRWK